MACANWYELGVWSSASDAYVEKIVEEIFPKPKILHFAWGLSRTTTMRTLPDDYERFGASLGDYHIRNVFLS